MTLGTLASAFVEIWTHKNVFSEVTSPVTDFPAGMVVTRNFRRTDALASALMVS